MKVRRYMAALPARTALLVLLAAPLLCSCAASAGRDRGLISSAAAPAGGAPRATDQYDSWDRDENGGLKRDWPMGLFILLIVTAAGAL